MRTRTLLAALPLQAAALSAALLGGCAADTLVIGEGDTTKAGDGKYDSSVEAVFVDMEFDGTVLASSGFNVRQKIQDQMLYTIGHLNEERSVGRLDQLELTNIDTERVGNLTKISYHARLPVAWGRKNNVPSTYTFALPADISFSGQEAFTDKYSHDCVDFGAHDVDSGSMWYYYRPESFRCELDSEDIVELTATVTLSTINTTGKYPEYHKIWEDDVLKVVAVFGKFEDGETSNGDAGISAYNRFVRSVKSELARFDVVSEPANIPFSPGVEMPDIIFEGTLDDGKRVEVTVLLIDGVRSGGADFDARYAELSSDADLIIYNGHAGLGSNIRALARKGHWITGQYVIVFMNGCDTYAYVDSALADAHAAVNPDDPTGTKHMDIVTNAMPSFFREMPGASMAMLRGLLAHDEPVTYEKIFTSIDSSEVVLVSGEQDNEFVPDFGGGGQPVAWEGLEDGGNVARNQEVRFETPTLESGRYVFELTGTNDADLYVRVGSQPTFELFDCRPFKSGSRETCAVNITTPAAVHIMVRGWATSSDWQLVGAKD